MRGIWEGELEVKKVSERGVFESGRRGECEIEIGWEWRRVKNGGRWRMWVEMKGWVRIVRKKEWWKRKVNGNWRMEWNVNGDVYESESERWKEWCECGWIWRKKWKKKLKYEVKVMIVKEKVREWGWRGMKKWWMWSEERKSEDEVENDECDWMNEKWCEIEMSWGIDEMWKMENENEV